MSGFYYPQESDPVINIYILLDASITDAGETNTVINGIAENILCCLKETSRKNIGVEHKISVLTYGRGVKWLTGVGSVNLEKFKFPAIQMEKAAFLDLALDALNSKLSSERWSQRQCNKFVSQVILFITDGKISCSEESLDNAIDRIQKNRLFCNASKLAFTLTDQARLKHLTKVVGTTECIFMPASHMESDCLFHVFRRLLVDPRSLPDSALYD